jgi:hypothetical protein
MALALAFATLDLGMASTASAYGGRTLYEPNATTNPNDLDSYPVAVRLSHSGAANGTVLATFERNAGDSTDPPPGWLIYRSTDDGQSFSKLSEVAPAVHPDWTFTVQPHLMELSQAAGGFPAGTLLLATGLMPDPITQTELQVYASTDHGATWSYVSDIATAGPGGSGVWEPFLNQLPDGRIVAYYSHEGVSGHSQIIAEKVSSDGGKTWGTETPIWQSADLSDRPGMPTVARMGNGKYLMSVEDCGAPGDYCAAHTKISSDGLTWGSGAGDMGTQAVAASGHRMHGNPFVTWSPAGSQNGTVILVGKDVTTSNPDQMAGNHGQTLFVNYNYGTGTWWELTAPVPWVAGGYQSGYRSAALPSSDGTDLLYLTSTYSGSGQRNRIVHGTANGGVLPYRDPFASTGTDTGWQTFGGTWQVSDGVYRVTSSGRGEKSVAGSTVWSSYTMEGDVRLDAGGNAGLSVRVSDPATGVDSQNAYYVGLSSVDGAFIGRQRYDWTLLGGTHPVPGGVQVGTWYHLKVQASGCTFTVTASPADGSGTPVTFTQTDSTSCLDHGAVGVRMDATPASFRNITVTYTG